MTFTGLNLVVGTGLKTITLLKDYFIHPSASKINQLKVILIHEISHTTTRGFHGEEWIAQMKKTAERADQLGEIELAQFIREEVDRYVMRNKVDRYKGIL